MPSRLNPYLSFRENAREAMEFYQGVFAAGRAEPQRPQRTTRVLRATAACGLPA
jgi:uncharacterized glyoxalase superfamily protein PhnB